MEDVVVNKIIDEYSKFIKKLKQGYRIDYLHILDMICFLEILSNNKFIYEKLINE